MTASSITTNAPIDIVLARLERVKANGKRSWMALCPAHQDRNPSLSITEGRDQRVLMKCHAGCAAPDIVRAIGMEMNDLFPARPEGASSFSTSNEVAKQETPRSIAMTKSYNYTDENAVLLYQVCRFVDAATGKKDFRQRRPLEGNQWEWKLGDVRLVPYRLPEVIEAIAEGRPVFVVEGEKDADTLAEFGYTATTNSGGAGKWREEFAPIFTGANVFVLPDNDDAGRAHAEHVATSLTAGGAMVRIAPLPGAGPKGDVTDWLVTHTREEMEAAVRRARRWTGPTLAENGLPFAIRAIDAPEMDPITWCVEELFIAGEIALIVGDGGSFKSTSAFHIAGAVAGGYSAFNRFPTTQRPSMILSAEDGAGVVMNRLEAIVVGMGWDRELVLSNVHIIASHDAKLTDAKWQEHLIAEALRLNVGYVVCDPLYDLFSGDENSNTDLKPVISFCRKLASITNAAVNIVHHAAKVKDGQRLIDRVRGAASLRDAARCVLFFESKPEGISVEHLKMNRAEKLKPFMLSREIESHPTSRAVWASARFTYQTQADAILDRAESFVLDQITKSPTRLNSTMLRQAAKGAGVRGEDIGRATTTLQARGLIDFEAGRNNQRFWLMVENDAEPAQTEMDKLDRPETKLVQLAQSHPGKLQHTTSEPTQPAPPKGGAAGWGTASRSGQAGQARPDDPDEPGQVRLHGFDL